MPVWGEIRQRGMDRAYHACQYPGFQPCAMCGCLVQWGKRPETGEWMFVSPLLGYMHLCGENCACKDIHEDPVF